jgi:hypothetical protein
MAWPLPLFQLFFLSNARIIFVVILLFQLLFGQRVPLNLDRYVTQDWQVDSDLGNVWFLSRETKI